LYFITIWNRTGKGSARFAKAIARRGKREFSRGGSIETARFQGVKRRSLPSGRPENKNISLLEVFFVFPLTLPLKSFSRYN